VFNEVRTLLLDIAEASVKKAVTLGASYADARAESSIGTMIRRSNDIFDQSSKTVVNGIGVRVLANGSWGFSSTVIMTREAAVDAAKKAVDSARAVASTLRDKIEVRTGDPARDSVKAVSADDPSEVEIGEKMKIASMLVDTAREEEPSIVSASSVYMDGSGRRAIVTSDGASIEVETNRILFTINAVAKDAEKLVSAREYEGTRKGFKFLETIDLRTYARKASQRAVSLLKAKPAPSGRYHVVMDPELAGTFVHEAVGHACEADLVASGESILRNMLQKRIGSDLVTICDDPTLANGWGSFKYDDEGVRAVKRLLVEKGRLTGYISDKETSARLGIELNGGARAESYASRPIVRMSNTYMSPGDHSVDELFEKINRGVYAKGTRGGQVDTSKGTFQFSAEEAYLIENGRLTIPLLDVSLSGLTLETLNNIIAVAKDLKHHPGFCGKAYQSIPAGDGAPHFLARNVVVGGRI
jgi:TldD protein